VNALQALARLAVTLAAVLVVASAGCGAGPGAPPDAAAPPDARPPTPPRRLGAQLQPDGDLVVRVASTRATRLEVWLYDTALGAPERLHVRLVPEASDPSVFAARVTAADLAGAGLGPPATIYYGLRAWGPNWPYDPSWTPGSGAGFVADVDADGDRMNPNKLLVDPYARELSHDPENPDNLDGNPYRTGPGWRDVDSAPVAPKGVVLPDAPAPADVGPRPIRPLRDDVVYEVHLRGLTAGDPAAGACRGTYAAAAARADELAELGVTAIELLPVQETNNDANDVDPTSDAGDNYWGYATLAFFAPDRRYACDRTPGGPTRELQAMVRAFHARDIKVLVDVVYNHTAEGGGGSLLSWRGLDDGAYYELSDDGYGFADQTGIGASTNATSGLFRGLVLDSLAYWHQTLGVDGFRFDEAPVLANGCDRGCYRWVGGDPGGLLRRIADDLPARPAGGGDGVDLIAEPWGVGAGTYQLGSFPPGWSEWNGAFRDTMRADQNQLDVAPVTLGWLADRVAGSQELFHDDGRAPSAPVNYLVSHDGFTLHDLYACNGKHNDQPWPYGPSSGGADDNKSWDHGGDPVRQRQAARTGMALLALSVGVPMIEGGDEVLRGQGCNNNPYDLDSPAMWLPDPATVPPEAAAFRAFAARLLSYRRDHAALRPAAWPDGNTLGFYGAGGARIGGAIMDDPAQQFLAWRFAGAGDGVRSLYVMYDGGLDAVQATLPAPAGGASWVRILDTDAAFEAGGNFVEHVMGGLTYDVHPRSLVLFEER